MKIAFYTAMFPVIRKALQSPQVLGFGYLSAYLRKQFPDIEIELRQNEEELFASPTDIVGITCATFTYGQARKIARQAKERLGALTVIGGPHFTTLPETLDIEFDYGVRGEGELTFAELIAQLLDSTPAAEPEKINGLVFRRDGQTILNPPRDLIDDLDTLPFPDRDIFGNAHLRESGNVSIISSRGCPHTCHFCSTTSHWGKCLRLFSPDYVVEELSEIISRYRPKIIQFEDDMFVSSRKRLEAVAEKILSRGFHKEVEFHVSARADRMSPETGEVLKAINTRTVYMGLESCEDHVLEALGKRGLTGRINQRALDIVAQYDMKAIVSFIFGTPGETLDDAYKTIQFIYKNIEKFHHVEASPLHVFPGTEFWNQAMEKGIIDEKLTGIVFDDVDVENGWLSLMERYPKLNDEMTRGEMAAMSLVHKELTQHIDLRVLNESREKELRALRSGPRQSFPPAAGPLLWARRLLGRIKGAS